MIQTEPTKQNERLQLKGSFVFWLLAFLAAVGLDQLLKFLAFSSSFGNFLDALRPIVAKENFKNFEFAFSWPLPTWLIYFIYTLVMLALVVYIATHYRNFTRRTAWAWLLVFAGACSNIGERVTAGYVKDFIYIWHGIFNLADFYILLGLVLLILPNKN